MPFMPKSTKFLLFVLFFILTACGRSTATPAATRAAGDLPALTGLPPTFTPLPPGTQLLPTHPVVTVTQEPLPTLPTSTPVPFGDTAVEIHYTIPALNLDRRLQGGINSQIILVDENTGKALKRSNQAGVMLELQQALPALTLNPVPAECTGCVQLRYELPFAQEQREGWLQDQIMLASLDNYLSAFLGPHFPPGTAVGLYRRATPFAPAHTIAITEDGLLYRWLATESEVAPPVSLDTAILAEVASLNLEELASEYVTTCAGTSPEVLYLRQGDVIKEITLLCPEYVLPAPLASVYSELNALMETKLAASENVLPRPPAAFPLDALLAYQRIDGAALTIYQDGTAVALDSSSQVITGTIGSSQVISITTDLLTSGVMSRDLSIFAASVTPPGEGTTVHPQSVVIMRGENGVFNAAWLNTGSAPPLASLNEFLDELLAALLETAVPEQTVTPQATLPITPTVTTTPAGTPDS